MELDIQCGAEKHKKYKSLIALITFQKDLERGGGNREREWTKDFKRPGV